MTAPDFAKRVAELERVMQTNLPTINNAIIADLLACIRAQRKALADSAAALRHSMAYAGGAGFMSAKVEATEKEARAVLAAWPIEGGEGG